MTPFIMKGHVFLKKTVALQYNFMLLVAVTYIFIAVLCGTLYIYFTNILGN